MVTRLNRRVRIALLCAAGALCMAGPSKAQPLPQYRVVELPAGIYGDSINAHGQVTASEVEEFPEGGTQYNGFRIDGATGTVLATHENSLLLSINASGDSVGNKAGTQGIWKGNGGFVALSPPGVSSATSINDGGHVAGTRITSSDYSEYEGVVLRDGALVALERFGVRDLPRAINNKGQVVGDTWAEYTEISLAAYWNEDGTGFLLPTSGWGTYATDINDKGTIVGGSDTGRSFGVGHALKWEDGVLVDLTPGALNSSTAQGINNNGDIVGSIYDAAGSSSALLWTGGVQINLNDVVVGYAGHLSSAGDINDEGWILGRASKGNDEWRTVVLIPVPEPAAMLMVTVGIGIVLLRNARRRSGI